MKKRAHSWTIGHLLKRPLSIAFSEWLPIVILTARNAHKIDHDQVGAKMAR
jgi:hypothetical protein